MRAAAARESSLCFIPHLRSGFPQPCRCLTCPPDIMFTCESDSLRIGASCSCHRFRNITPIICGAGQVFIGFVLSWHQAVFSSRPAIAFASVPDQQRSRPKFESAGSGAQPCGKLNRYQKSPRRCDASGPAPPALPLGWPPRTRSTGSAESRAEKEHGARPPDAPRTATNRTPHDHDCVMVAPDVSATSTAMRARRVLRAIFKSSSVSSSRSSALSWEARLLNARLLLAVC